MRPFGSSVVVGLLALGLSACTSHTSGNGAQTSPASQPSTSTPVSPPSSPVTSDSLTPSVTPTSSSSTSPVQQQTDLVLTRSGWDPATHTASAVAILPGKIIQTGSCTLTITSNGVSKTFVKASTPDVSSTDCGQLTITAALASGSWTGSVMFSGGGVTATSVPFTFEVTS